MTVHLEVDNPQENFLDLNMDFISHGEGRIKVSGVGNHVKIGNVQTTGRCALQACGGARIIIGDGCILGETSIHALAQKAEISIGKGCACNGRTYFIVHEEAGRILIGNECLFASDVTIAIGAMGKLIDLYTGARVKGLPAVQIGSRVWLSTRSMIRNYAVIGDDSIVGFESVVEGVFPPNSLVAGNPARLARRGVRWTG